STESSCVPTSKFETKRGTIPWRLRPKISNDIPYGRESITLASPELSERAGNACRESYPEFGSMTSSPGLAESERNTRSLELIDAPSARIFAARVAMSGQSDDAGIGYASRLERHHDSAHSRGIGAQSLSSKASVQKKLSSI